MPSDIDKIEALKKSYLNTFSSESGKKVLDDLATKCFSRKTTFNDNPQRLAFNEGLRFTYLHIINTMNMNIKKLRELQERENAK